ncbi:phosphoribosyltransferase [Chelatococcus reniformis]|uniref:Phosphoribosyltransferase n=1 Tax=Chelatococcus reniformis TaxID=1494448 RepID=A0A916UDI3_9HYPH|nr:phosphoribosyltransferase [Chelatococcus reniformis]GGC68479.1 hypothetical protein GCM10010994_28820 [Chelatococcus reniformis]
MDWNAALGLNPGQPTDRPAPLGALVLRPTLYSRNGVTWASVRSWASRAKAEDIAALRAEKALPLSPVLAPAAEEVAELAERLIGKAASVTTVPCGHSRRPDCFGKQLAVAVADRLAAPFQQCFEDRFVRGASHPKEFRKLAPISWIDVTSHPGIVLLVDDVATSGWHMEEALTALRGKGCAAVGIAWISGTVTVSNGSRSSAHGSDWTATL